MDTKKALCILLLIIMNSYTIYAVDAPYEEGVFIIKTRQSIISNIGNQGLSNTKEVENVLKELGAVVEDQINLSKRSNGISISSTSSNNDNALIKVKVEKDQENNFLRRLEQEEWVQYVERNYYIQIKQTPSDPLNKYQYYLSSDYFSNLYNIPVSTNVIVAVLDTGVDYTHPDLRNQIAINELEIEDGRDTDNNGVIDDIYGANFYNSLGESNGNPMDDNSHGTHIAGTIAAENNNQIGVSGLNSGAKILPVKFLNSSGSGTTYQAVLGFYYAVSRGARIINCSWGFRSPVQSLQTAIDYAVDNGVIVLAATGNDGANIDEYPASYSNVLAIGSLDSDDSLSYYSNTGDQVDFATYGRNIYSTIPDNNYAYKSGTSQSTAIMTGIISRLVSAIPNISNATLMNVLITSTDDLGSPGKDSLYGYGNIDTSRLIEVINNSNLFDGSEIPIDEETAKTTEGTRLILRNAMNFPNPVKTDTNFGFDSNLSGSATIKIFNLKGKQVKELSLNVIADYNKINWDTRDDNGEELQNGSYPYLIKVEAGNYTQIKKGIMAILRN